MPRSVVITGLGLVTRDAQDLAAFEALLHKGGKPPQPPQQFDASRFRARNAFATPPANGARNGPQADAAQRDFLTRAPSREELDCAGHGLAAALQAITQAGLSPDELQKAGCVLATTSGGLMDDFADLTQDQDADVQPPELLAPASAAQVLYRLFGLSGPLCSFSCACVSSLGAISHAFSRVRHGEAPVMIVGGSDRMREADFAGFNALRAMDRDSCRPFDTTRRGMMIGDGAAMLVLEDEAHALARGARPLMRLSGMGLATDSHHITSPNAQGLIRAMQQALTQAGRRAEEITYVNCHGTGTALNDAAEIEALSAVFDAPDMRPVIGSTKGTTGHLLGSAGAIETIATVLALQSGMAPVMATTHNPEETGFPLPLAGTPQPLSGRIAMNNSLGFGGLNASLILEAYDSHDSQGSSPCA